MKKNKRIFLIVFMTIITIFSSINFMNINVSYANEEESLINISECSSSFMANYFEESKEIRESDNKENILIVTSTSKVRDGKGASKIVAAPNNQYILQYDSAEEKDKALKSFKAQKNIVSVEENIVYTINETYYWSWGIEKTGLDQAIEVANSKGLSEVTVAIIDTGCDIDLFNATKYSEKIIETYNVLDPESDMDDKNGHGTHIAGTIAEGTPDNVKILPIKVSDDGKIRNTDIIEAINYVVYNNKADVINMSFGGYDKSEALYQAISAANEKNIICVAAAGNDDTSYNHYPSAYDNTISIAAVDSNLEKAYFSNYGETITFAAPGVNILSLHSNYGLVEMSGTSMATPHAVCAAAILKGYNKEYTLEDTIEVLRKYAIDLGDEGRDNYFGYGLINLAGITYCDCNCSNCDSIYCKECDCNNCIFSEKAVRELDKIEVTSVTLLGYNYGSITNLSNIEIGLTYTDGFYETKKLNEIINDCTITGYIPDATDKQIVTITYNGKETSFEITQPSQTEAWEYEKIDDETIKIIGFNKWEDDDFSTLYIPELIGIYEVVSIGEGVFKNRDDIENYIIPDTVTTVEYEAFYNSDVKSIKANKISVEDYAFGSCYSLKNVDADITGLGENSFSGTNIESIVLTNDITSIPNSAFLSSGLKNITLPNSLTSIGPAAFADTNIVEINIPNTVTEIRERAFFNCRFLETVYLKNGLVTIGERAFWRCNCLESINIPSSVTTIGESAFLSCSLLTAITVDSGNEIYDSRNACHAIIETATNKLVLGCRSTIIPNSVKIIGNSSFVDNITLTKLVIPNGVEKIESNAFKGCTYLEEITIPKSVTEIGEAALDTGDFMDVTVWVYKDSYAATYAIENGLNYRFIDASISDYKVYLEKNDYRAFETVDTTGMYIRVWYDDGTTEDITEGFNIKYSGENTSFRYGDTYFTVSAYSQTGQYIEKEVTVTVIKAVPEYTEPTGLKAIEGQYLFQIELPDGFEWMDAGQLIEGYGNLGFRIRYIPEDTNNYLTIDNIIVILSVRSSKHDGAGVTYRTNSYKAFETVNTDEIHLTIQYNDGIVEKITEGLIIEYQNGNTSFRYGDTYYTVSAYTELGELVSVNVNVTVSKATPQYTVPTGITAQVGQKLSEIALPEGFSWMDDSQIIQEAGNVVYKARYTPEDTNNYEIVENIDININANKIAVKIPTKVEKTYVYTGSDQYLLLMNFDNSKMKITGNVRKDVGEQTAIVSLLNENYVWEDGTTKNITFTFKIEKANQNYVSSSDYVGVYDGNSHSINLNVNSTDYNIKYSVNNQNYDLNTMPTFKDIGEYTVNYKITKNNYNDVIGSNKVCIYGVQKLDSTLELRNNILVIKNYNNSFKDICNRIKLFSPSYTYNHYDKNKVLTNNTLANTGDSVKININNLKEYEYAISILGDVNGDGKISALDYVKIKNHIMKTNLISSDVYLISADVNDDGKISALDYVRIKNRIMNGGV